MGSLVRFPCSSVIINDARRASRRRSELLSVASARLSLHRKPGLSLIANATTGDVVSDDDGEAPRRSSSSRTVVVTKDEVEASVKTLKLAAKMKSVEPVKVFAAIRCLERARLDPSEFLRTIGGDGAARTWMLVFTAGPKVVNDSFKGGPGGGRYFPLTAVQRFDAAAGTIENGIYLGPIGVLKFMGRFVWTKNRLNFLFDTVSLRIGSFLGPFKFTLPNSGREPSKVDPFFLWYYADHEIIVAKGRGGGVAMWVRCSRLLTSSNLAPP